MPTTLCCSVLNGTAGHNKLLACITLLLEWRTVTTKLFKGRFKVHNFLQCWGYFTSLYQNVTHHRFLEFAQRGMLTEEAVKYYNECTIFRRVRFGSLADENLYSRFNDIIVTVRGCYLLSNSTFFFKHTPVCWCGQTYYVLKFSNMFPVTRWAFKISKFEIFSPPCCIQRVEREVIS